jgi:hypothetical protein
MEGWRRLQGLRKGAARKTVRTHKGAQKDEQPCSDWPHPENPRSQNSIWGFPTTFLVNRKGQIYTKYTGT